MKKKEDKKNVEAKKDIEAEKSNQDFSRQKISKNTTKTTDKVTDTILDKKDKTEDALKSNNSVLGSRFGGELSRESYEKFTIEEELALKNLENDKREYKGENKKEHKKEDAENNDICKKNVENNLDDNLHGPGVVAWIDYRLPVFSFFKHLAEYKVPKNLNYLWNLGSIAGIALVIQIVTGVFLAMHYDPDTEGAFNSVERIMRSVNYGWLIRYIHAVGASMFFVVVYIHIIRGLYYGSYKKPRELLWQIGVVIFIMMMATAFMGYVLPWGQMSYWGATVITNLFSAIPFVGESVVTWLWGGFSVDNPTLNRFFSLHYLLPFIIVAFVCLHLVALHTHGSNNPKGIDLKEKDKIPFHPYYTIKDFLGFGVYFLVFAFFVFYEPNYLGHPDNYTPANPLVTPAHIVPEWYFLPFYAILRAIPLKLGGVIAMFSSIIILMFLPWLDRSPVRSANYRPWYRIAFFIFIIDVLILGFVGGRPPDGWYLIIGRLATLYYFFHFLILLPIISRYEVCCKLPESL